jgi:hypothetical protein
MKEKLVHLPEKYHILLQNWTDEVKRLFGPELKGILLYGSATGKNFVPKASDINTIILLEKVQPENLKKYLPLQKKYRKKRMVAPLFLDWDYVLSSADVFPLEFLDIKKNHLLLWGEDPFKELELDLKNLRFQCEQELKGKMIRLRQAYLEFGEKPRELEKLLVKSFSSLSAVLRGILRLKGIETFELDDDFLEKLKKEFQVETGSFSKILELKKRKMKLNKIELDDLFADYLKSLKELTEKIDKWNG